MIADLDRDDINDMFIGDKFVFTRKKLAAIILKFNENKSTDKVSYCLESLVI